MKFYDINGNELEDKDSVDYQEGRYLQDEEDPDKYIFSPWNVVPAREEESAPEATQLDMVEAQTMYTALMTDTLLPEEDE